MDDYRDMDSHGKNCFYQSVACLAVDIGCDWIGKRKEAVDHEKICQWIPMRFPLLKVSISVS